MTLWIFKNDLKNQLMGLNRDIFKFWFNIITLYYRITLKLPLGWKLRVMLLDPLKIKK